MKTIALAKIDNLSQSTPGTLRPLRGETRSRHVCIPRHQLKVPYGMVRNRRKFGSGYVFRASNQRHREEGRQSVEGGAGSRQLDDVER